MSVQLLLNTAITIAMSAFMSWAIARPKKWSERIKHDRIWKEEVNQTVLLLLRGEIQRQYLVIHNRGHVKPYEREGIAKLYQDYKARDGNGYIDTMVTQIYNMEVKE